MLMFQMAHIGPMMGQANVFYRYLDDKIDVAINRYHMNAEDFEVPDNHLKDKQFLVNDSLLLTLQTGVDKHTNGQYKF